MSFPDFPQPAEELPSLVDGITVFRTAEIQTEHRKVVHFSCPNCGGNKAYSTASGALTCTQCGYESPPSPEGKAAPEARPAFSLPIAPAPEQKHEFRHEILEEARTSFVPGNIDISCQDCGVELTIPPQNLSHTCPFCNSHQVIQQKRSDNALSPQFLLPFAITGEDCVAPARAWLGSHWLVPKDLQEAVKLRAFEQVYVPYWAFDAKAEANWKAEVGYDETETYTDSEGNTRTRTTTRWRWENGYQGRSIDNLLVPGSFHLDDRLLTRLQTFPMDSLQPYNPDFLAGISAQAYEVSLEDAWTQGRSVIRDRMKEACREDALSGRADKVRHLSLDMELEDEAWQYLLLPFLISSFQYEGRQYQMIVNGRTGDMVGYRPIDWQKFNLVAVLAFIPALLAMLGALLTGQPEVPFFIGVGLAIAAGFYLFTLHKTAKSIEG